MKTGKRAVLIAALIGGVSAYAAAAEPHVQASLNRTQIAVDESVILSIEVTGLENVPNPGRLALPHFQVDSAGKTSSFQFVNGKTSSQTVFRYVLTPTRTGSLEIPSITMMFDGQSYTTEPLSVNVVAAAPSPPAPAGQSGAGVPAEGLRPIFLTAETDKSRSYVGEQILLTVRFLRRPGVRLAAQPHYNEPDMTGFLSESLEQHEYETTLNGAKYLVTELRYALFPTSDGEFAIGNATVDLAVRSDVDPFNPNSFFESFFGQTRRVRLTTRAIPIQVRALPKNKPLDFSGAVGRYKLTSKVDAKAVEVGKPFNLVVTVEGVGNVQALREPDLPDVPGLRRYETLSETKIDRSGAVLLGRKTFTTLFIPQVSGQLTIPGVTYTYFNPNVPQYVSETTEPITLDVATGTLAEGESRPRPGGGTAQAPESVRIVERDIRFIKSGPIRAESSPLVFRPPFLAATAIPPVFALAALAVRFRLRRRERFAATYRSREAHGKAQPFLRRASKSMAETDPAPFYGALAAALANFLADKFGLSPSGLVWDDIDRRLAERNVSDELRERVRETVHEADRARFAPSTFDEGGRETRLAMTKSLLRDLDKVI